MSARVCIHVCVCVSNPSEAMTTIMQLHLKTKFSFSKFSVHIIVFKHHNNRGVWFPLSGRLVEPAASAHGRQVVLKHCLSFAEHACRTECASEFSENGSHDELASAL